MSAPSVATIASPDITLRIERRIMDHTDVNRLLLHAVRIGASDIFIQDKRPVHAMLQGDLVTITNRIVDDAEVKSALTILAGRDNASTDISSRRSVNAAYSISEQTGLAETQLREAGSDIQPAAGMTAMSDAFRTVTLQRRRKSIRHFFRVNAVPVNPRGCEITVRLIAQDPPTIDKVGLDENLVRQIISPHGLFLVSGATGSGKTTTFAAIIRYILENDTPIKGHILTHEEPIEYRYDKIRSNHSLLVQSQIPDHFETFHAANREAMRRRPTMVLVGELRDLETIQSALEIALTGHAIFATVHATDVASIPQRLVSRYPQEVQREATFDIIDTTHAMMTQRLVKGTDGKLVALREYLILTRELRNELLSLKEQSLIAQALRTMVPEYGSTFAQDAKRLYDEGRISADVAEEFLRTR